MKIVYLALGLAFLMLGLIGLVFPLIPGVLFLIGAVFLLGKVSTRVKAWSQSSATYTDMERRMALLGGVNWGDRIKLGALMTVDACVRGVEATASLAAKTVRRFSN